MDYFDVNSLRTVPGTTYAMHDYLFDKYMTSILGGVLSSYPMTENELDHTMNEYLKDNASFLLEYVDVIKGSFITATEAVRGSIKKNIPVLLVLTSGKYTNSIHTNKPITEPHIVVAYGYDSKNRYQAHFGWEPHSATNATVILSNASIYGYYAIDYIGPHRHSKNIIINTPTESTSACGCGHIHRYTCARHNDETHIYYCECGDSYFENHTFISSRVATKPLIISCKKCGYTKTIL